VRGHEDPCGCFPTGRHYPGIADLLAEQAVRIVGLVAELAAHRAWTEHPFAVIDFETTGTDRERDRVIEIAIVLFDGGTVSGVHQWLVDPGMPIPDESRAVHGISDDDVRGKPSFAEVARDVLAALSGRLPVAYNAEFDRGFLHAEMARGGFPPRDDLPPALRESTVWIDPLVWAREIQKYEKGKKLTEVAERMGIVLENAHRAAADAEAAGRVLLALAKDMPRTYGELVRLQGQYAARQDADYAAWLSRRQ
jgi:DNA polymerase-3 subunit epsilon